MSAESRLTRVIKTFTFRLALVYVGLFSLSVICLFAFIYTFAMNYLQDQINDTLRLRYNYLMNEYRENGSNGVEARIKELIEKDEDGTSVYLLVNRDYEKLSGNLDEWPTNPVKDASFEKEGSWSRFFIEDSKNADKGVEVKAILAPISKWRYILVGESLQNNETIEQTILQTFWASLLVTMLMAFLGSLIMTRSVMRRINVINRSANTIMHGHLSARIPYTRGGDEFDELSANLNSMLDRIETLLQSLSDFANNIAHDLRSPLNRIITRVDAGIRSIDSDNPAYPLLEKNIQDLEGLVGTFNSILKISELEANTEFRKFEPCDLQRIIANLIELYEPAAMDKRINLYYSLPEPIVISGEKNLLTQLIANLMDNALKFTPTGGTVEIAAQREGERVDITIADNGPGIPQAYRDKVFEKFFRLEESRNTRGNGLGLSLVAAIARIHNIAITLEDNQPGLRIRMRFTLAPTLPISG